LPLFAHQRGAEALRALPPPTSQLWPGYYHGQEVTRHFIGLLTDDFCTNCKACHFLCERAVGDLYKEVGSCVYKTCCAKGKVYQKPISYPFPLEVQNILLATGFTPHQRTMIHDKIRMMNSLLSFASITTTGEEFRFSGGGPFIYKIQGNLVRNISEVRPYNSPRFSQLYFVDVEAGKTGISNTKLYRDLPPFIKQLTLQIYEHLTVINPYAQTYQMIREVIDHLEQNGQDIPNMALSFNNTRDIPVGHGFYGLNTANKIAILYTGTMTPPHLQYL